MNGYQTSQYEKNSVCGGVAYAWNWGGYLIKGAANWIAESGPSSTMHHLLRKLIDFLKLEIGDPNIFITVEHNIVLSVILTLGWMNFKLGGYPIGSSTKLTDILMQKYQVPDGKLFIRSEVDTLRISRGSYQSWAPTPSFIGKTLPKTIDPVKNLFITGEWVWAGGCIPGVVRIARHTAQIICYRDKKKFMVREN